MTALSALIRRDTKLFFKDRGMFFTSLITPIILLILYATFLRSVYEDSFNAALSAAGATVDESLIAGCVGGQLVSSLLAVSCVTVAFCSNMLVVQDKVNGSRGDLCVAPVGRGTLALGYYISTLFATLIVCFAATAICMIYLGATGWYLSASDVFLVFSDVVLLALFGTAMSSIINHFLKTQGQMSAVGTIVSAGYGFICGAYMPISQFSDGLQKVMSFLPGTYGTSLMRNHAMRGVFAEMSAVGFPEEVVEMIKDSVDCNLYFFGEKVALWQSGLVLGGAVALLVAAFVLINVLDRRKERK